MIIQLLPLVIYRGQLNDNNLACVFFHQNQWLTFFLSLKDIWNVKQENKIQAKKREYGAPVHSTYYAKFL